MDISTHSTRRRRRVLVAVISAAMAAPVLLAASPAGAAPNVPPTITIVDPNGPFGTRPVVQAGDTFRAEASDVDGRVVRVEWFFSSDSFNFPITYEEPLGVSRSAPFTLVFDGPARLFLGDFLVARAYDNRGATTDATLAVSLEGSAGKVPTDVRFALPYISQAESGSARQSLEGTVRLPVPTGAPPVPGESRPIRGYSGTGGVRFEEAGAFVQWAAKTSQGGFSDEAIPAGRYALTFRYNNALAAPVSLRLTTARARALEEQPNAVDRGLVTFAPTGRANGHVDWRTVTKIITLPAGINNVRLTAESAPGPIIDYLVITPVG